jgi:hypothetical protein
VVDKWHPSKLTIIVSLLAILISVLGSTVTTGIIFGRALNSIDTVKDEVTKITEEIKELRMQDAISAADRAALNANWHMTYDALCRLEGIVTSSKKLSEDSNRMLKKAF